MKTTLAALLHDIGKFYQRTGIPLGNDSLYEQCCKEHGTYRHGGFTAKFIDENLKSVPDFPNFLYLSAGHHVTNESIVKRADQISSGHDRRDQIEDEANVDLQNEMGGRREYIRKRLFTIFNEVNITGNELKKYYQIGKMSNYVLEKYEAFPPLDKAMSEYKELYNEMITKLRERVKNEKSYDIIHNILYPIIKEYTGLIPANTYSDYLQTVSLFDHLKLTAAIARCLEIGGNDEFLIVDYDLSGIQSFIYKITEGRNSKPNIAKLLRTRSFYLNILSDFIAYAIANEFSLSYENILYSSGGRGRILLPRTKECLDKLKEFNNNLEKEMFHLFKGEISFTLTCFETNGDELANIKFDDITSFERANRISLKNQKFKAALSEKGFEYVKEAPQRDICPMCNTHEISGGGMCDFCNSLLGLNDDVLARKNEFLIEFDYQNSNKNSDYKLNVGNIGTIHFYLKGEEKEPEEKAFYMSINNSFLGETKYYARSNISSLSFEDIAKKSYGDKKIAVVKMDVDNLGYIFLNGIRSDHETISKILTLSRTMDTFFSKRIAEISKKEEYDKGIYINYSGGDDLVIILPASMALDFVNDINKEFASYTAENPSLHISAGIEILKPKFPIRYAIDSAEDNLSKAKSVDGKQSVGVLDVVIPNCKIKELLDEIDLFTKEIEKEKSSLSRGLVYDIYSILLLALDKKEPEKAYQRFIPIIAYSLKRNVSDDDWFTKLSKIFVSANVSKETIAFYKVVLGFALMKTNIGGKNE